MRDWGKIMKLFNKLPIILFLLIIPLGAISLFAINKALLLDGESAYVQIDANKLKNYKNTTVEAWIRWDEFAYFSQPLGFGEAWNCFVINNLQTKNTFQYFVYEHMQPSIIMLADFIEAGTWMHVVAASGDRGLRLYINGMLVADNPISTGFADIKENVFTMLIGKSQWDDNAFFAGAIDEIKIWQGYRTHAQILADMYARPVLTNEDLLAYWSFDNSEATELCQGLTCQEYGTQYIFAELPKTSQLITPLIIEGVVSDNFDNKLKKAKVTLTSTDGRQSVTHYSDNNGQLNICILPRAKYYNMRASWKKLGTRKKNIELADYSSHNLNVVIQQQLSISGRLLTYGENYHGHVPVEAWLINDKGRAKHVRTVLSHDNGSYEFINLEQGTYQLRCQVNDKLITYPQNIKLSDKKTVRNIDFHFAPIKKGIWKNYAWFTDLQSHQIKAIAGDYKQNYYFATEKGVYRYNGADFEEMFVDTPLYRRNINDIYCDRDNKLWIAAQNGEAYVWTTDNLININEFYALHDVKISTFFEDEERMWVATRQNSIIELLDSGYRNFSFGKSMQNDIQSFAKVGQHKYHLGLYWGGVEYHVIRNDFVNITEINDRTISDILILDNGKNWYGTAAKGIIELSDNGKKKLTIDNGLLSDNIKTLQKNGADVWVGTDKGVSLYHKGNFINYTQADGLINNKVLSSLVIPDGGVIIGTERGISYYDKNSVQNYRAGDGLLKGQLVTSAKVNHQLVVSSSYAGVSIGMPGEFKNYTVKEGLGNSTIRAIAGDNEGNIWLGGASPHLSYIDNFGRVHSNNIEQIPAFDVHALYCHTDSTVWAGVASYGLIILKKNKDNYYEIYKRILIDNYIEEILPGEHDEIILATNNGLQKIINYQLVDIPGAKSLVDKHLTCIKKVSGAYWLGSLKGAYYFGADENKEKLLHKLADFYIRDIEIDAEGTVWFATQDNGLWGLKDNYWISLDTRDGLASNSINSIIVDDKSLWLSTSYGLSKYTPDITRPRINLTAVNGKRFSVKTGLPLQIFSHEHTAFSFEFIDFKTVKVKKQLRWRLLETGEAWSKPLFSHNIRMQNIVSGEYILQVQGIDRDGNISNTLDIPLVIKHTWYNNNWIFYPLLLLSLFVLGLAVLFLRNYYLQRHESHRLREKLLEKEKEKNKALEKANDDLANAKQQAIDANLAKSKFLANMSHEIRTPLNAVLGFAELLARTNKNPPEQNYINAINASGKNLLRIINDLLDLSKIEAGKMSLVISSVRPHVLVNEVAQMFSLKCAKKGVRLEVSIADDLPAAFFLDEVRLRQILINLVGNAVKFTAQGYIRIDVIANSLKNNYLQLKDEYVQLIIMVEDSGIGISAKNQKTIFQDFNQQVDQDYKQYGGTGLGLAICKRLVELMKGEISLSSTPDKGSCFTLILHKIKKDLAGNHVKTKKAKIINVAPPRGLNLELKNHPHLHTHLRTQALAKIKEVEDSGRMSQIGLFADNLAALANQYQHQKLELFAQLLSNAANNYDIDKINSMLASLCLEIQNDK